jgi:hypothetical protein
MLEPANFLELSASRDFTFINCYEYFRDFFSFLPSCFGYGEASFFGFTKAFS